jgi:DNA polymerase V
MIGIVDCNNFYCSCERLFRPDLINKPIVVLSNNDGCVVSRSEEAKKLEIPMGIPYFEILPLIEKYQVAVFSSNYNLYGDMSARVMKTLKQLTPNIEVYSIDEAFIDLSQVPPHALESTTKHIRTIVEQWTGIPVSIGVGPSKTLAKLANHYVKKTKTDYVAVIDTKEKQEDLLKQIRIEKIWGVGRSYAKFLTNRGITNGYELAQMSEDWIKKNMGGVVGLRLHKELNGELSMPLQTPLVQKKMVGTSRMFGQKISDLSLLKEAVAAYISRAAEKLRRQKSVTDTLYVSIVPFNYMKDSMYTRPVSVSRYITLPFATQATNELIKAAMPLVEELYEPGMKYSKAGVTFYNLKPADAVQANLFKENNYPQATKLMQALDNINFAMKPNMIHFATMGHQSIWQMKQNMKSAHYTTKLSELRKVK